MRRGCIKGFPEEKEKKIWQGPNLSLEGGGTRPFKSIKTIIHVVPVQFEIRSSCLTGKLNADLDNLLKKYLFVS